MNINATVDRKDIKEALGILAAPIDSHNADPPANVLIERLRTALHGCPEFMLQGKALQWKVRLILNDLGFVVSSPREGRESLEEFVFTNPHADPDRPVVVEVKSRPAEYEHRLVPLRQLDDFVFELSGEQEIRLEGLRSRPKKSGTVYREFGCLIDDSSPKHPTPHKGLLIQNAPCNLSFEHRSKDCFQFQQVEFAEKRGFCLLSLEDLLAWNAACRKSADMKDQFWVAIHNTFGVLGAPQNCNE